jgi:hypothetical protein
MVPLHFAPEQRTIGLNEKIASSLRSRRHRVAQDIAQSVFIDLA